jgi:hypothetical protein
MDEKNLESYTAAADEPAEKIEGEVKETDETKEIVKDDTVIPNSSGENEDDGAAVVEKLMQEIGIKEKDETDDSDTGENEDIPDAFTNAALAAGWLEDDIKEFAKDLDDASLLELIPVLSEQDNEEQIDTAQEKVSKSKGDESKKADGTAEEKDALQKQIAELKKEIASIKENTKQAQEVKEEQERAVIYDTVCQAFDEASKEFEIFGKTEELLTYPAGKLKGQVVPTSPAMKARTEVWEKAYPFIEKGIPVKDAMSIALTWYKGKNLEQDVRHNVIKDLKKHESKLSAKRSGKETVKTYENEEERKEDVVREAARRAGVKGAFGV